MLCSLNPKKEVMVRQIEHSLRERREPESRTVKGWVRTETAGAYGTGAGRPEDWLLYPETKGTEGVQADRAAAVTARSKLMRSDAKK